MNPNDFNGRQHALEIEKLKKAHADEMAHYKSVTDKKIAELKECIQKLNELLPERNEKEGFLVKQVCEAPNLMSIFREEVTVYGKRDISS